MNYKHYGKDELLGSDKESLTTLVKPMMNLEDAARHVSILTGKQTTKTDILMLANYNQLRLYARKASNNRDPLFAWIEIEFENDNLQEMLYLGLTQDFDYIELNYSDSIYIRDRGWLEKSLTKTIIRNLAGFYSIISTNTPSFAKTLAAKLSNGENVGVRCSETFCLAPKLMVEELLGEALPIVDFPVLFKVSYGDLPSFPRTV